MTKEHISKKKNSVLIVDDEVSLLGALKDKFTRGGFITFGAKNGEEGLEIAFREHPDIILLDIVMPKMDGMAMLSKLRENEWGKDVCVIMLTNLSDNVDIAQAMDNKIFEYFVKSNINLEDLVVRVNTKLKHSKS